MAEQSSTDDGHERRREIDLVTSSSKCNPCGHVDSMTSIMPDSKSLSTV